MRGHYEAYILVEVKDGKKYICGLNRPAKPRKLFQQFTEDEKQEFLKKNCLWN